MKKISTVFLLGITLALSAISCNNDESSDTISKVGELQLDFDGKTFVSTGVQAIVASDYISITAIRVAEGGLVQITIPSNKVGAYAFKDFIANVIV
ncbi:DUF6252 family protein [Flavobacterium sp. LAR06]|uniref:DUF6252 family protein n=1 Tax=Flavobacterium sp. LAR06 TaxID=3064897 RepID=UPI0035BF5469